MRHKNVDIESPFLEITNKIIWNHLSENIKLCSLSKAPWFKGVQFKISYIHIFGISICFWSNIVTFIKFKIKQEEAGQLRDNLKAHVSLMKNIILTYISKRFRIKILSSAVSTIFKSLIVASLISNRFLTSVSSEK